MSEPKLISPMLDGFVMGDAISEHNGVRCCPAMVKETGAKYIVKIISIPATQVQLEALLLTGACASEGAALSYFKEQAQGVVEEVDILRRLSKLEGFIPFDGCKIVPMENEVGYDVYLLSTYKRTLESFMRKHTMTHLAAVNLGLDMCASLAVCRQAGYLYVDLKPENIYISADHEYRIGDLGFIKLDSLKYASLPDKYRSAYTPPEINDAYAEINDTVDIYAAGMILYQAYNGGILPQIIPGEPLVAPAFADYEMAEIILKACATDPKDRWTDPVQMGQALVSYMQRNGANDDPIVPAAVVAPKNDEEELPAEETPEDNAVTAPVDGASDDAAENETEAEQTCLEEFADPAEEAPAIEDTPVKEDSPATEVSEDEDQDDTLLDEEEVANISYDEVSEELSDILTQADELIEHEPPAPAVAPEPIDVPIPEPIIEEAEESAEEDSEAPADSEEDPDEDDYEDDEYYDEDDEEFEERSRKTGKKILTALIVIALLAGLVFGGFLFFKNYYLQNIDSLTLQGEGSQLKVMVSSEISDSLLTVVCTDTHGTKMESPVENGVSVFQNLNANTLYTITIEVAGFHKLTGVVTDSYTTPAKTGILNFSALTGSEEGAVMLSFNIDGADSDSWIVTYAADGEDVRSETFSDHIVNISGLTVGKNYTFILSSADPLFLVGETQLSHVVTTPVFAQDLTVSSKSKNSINVSWVSPENATSDNWVVRCHSEDGYENTVKVAGNEAVFEDLDPKTAYTIEVIAEGMGTGTRTNITANAVTVSNAKAKVNAAESITVSWKSEKSGKWMVVYSLDGYNRQEIVRTDKTSATLTPVVPGTTYTISIQLEDGTTVLGGALKAEVPGAIRFNGKKLGLLAKDVDIEFRMCLRPEDSDWNRKDVSKDDYKTSFAVGEKAAFVLYVPSRFSLDDVPVAILFIIRDENGEMLTYGTTVRSWKDMWKSRNRYAELEIPVMPDSAGSYTMDIYFNGANVCSQDFEITE